VKHLSNLFGVVGLAASLLARADIPTAAEEYQDKLLDLSDPQSQENFSSEDAAYDPNGWARGWQVEAFGSALEQNQVRQYERGVALGAYIDTSNYGALSLNGTARLHPSESVFSLWQRELPFDQHWTATNGLGMINSSGIDLAREQYRFAVPTFPIAGFATTWRQDDRFQLHASFGQPGVSSGIRLAGFERLPGRIATLGAQWTIGTQWRAGLQLADADNVDTTGDDFVGTKRSNRSGYSALAWESENSQFQANVLANQEEKQDHPRLGLWLDGVTRVANLRHTYGAFRLEPELRWGYTSIASDLWGGYYRLNQRGQRWNWDAGLDFVDSVSGEGSRGVLLTGGTRFQIKQAIGVGGGVTIRYTDPYEWALFAFVDRQQREALTRFQMDLAGHELGGRGVQLQLEYNWPMPVSTRLSTSLLTSYEQQSSGGHAKRVGVSILGGGDFTDKLSIDSNLRWNQSSGSSRDSDRYIDLSLTWRPTKNWSLVGTYFDNRNNGSRFFAIEPLIPTVATEFSNRNRALFLSLRFEDRAGTPAAPLGGNVRSGAGTINGELFLDANNDGRRNANEDGAAQVTVLLDGRFSTQTDASGRFGFPYVASGKHVISVVSDNLPLPWLLEQEGRQKINVNTRSVTNVSIAATKP
jgi:hypothetical protein